MKDRTDALSTPVIQCLDADVFSYLASKHLAGVTSLVKSLAEVGDLPSLHNALQSGVAWHVDENYAVDLTMAVFKRYAGTFKDTSVSEQERSATHDLCTQWLMEGQKSGYPDLPRSVLSSMISTNLMHEDFVRMMGVVGLPQFGVDLNEIRPSNPQFTWHFEPEDRPGESALGQMIEKGLASAAIDLAGSGLSVFPITMKEKHPVNLAMQVTFASRPKPEILQKLQAVLSEPAEAGWLQLGDIVTAYLGKAVEPTSTSQILQDAAMQDHMTRYTQGEKESLPWAVALIGAGATFRHPEFVWECARTIKTHIRYDDDRGRTLEQGDFPLPHAVLFCHSSAVSRDVAARALGRMISEGGLDVDAKELGDRTLLQIAARLGHREAVEVLLEMGADSQYTGNAAGPATAAEMAKAAGHHDVVAMIHAYDARQSIERARRGVRPVPGSAP